LVAGRSLKLTLAGFAAGLAAALALTRPMSSLLFGVSPTDPVTFFWVAALPAVTALLACYLPARRAGVDAMIALRRK
jgi:hypothetical protein